MTDFDISLVTEKAQKLARDFVGVDEDNKVITNNKITSAQLRKFYNEFKGLERKYQTKILSRTPSETARDEIFISILPQIKIMKAKVSYARNRKLVPEVFEDWMKKSVDNINSAKQFEDFLLHFEAIVGFAYGTGKLSD